MLTTHRCSNIVAISPFFILPFFLSVPFQVNKSSRELDVVVFGITGVTGKYALSHILERRRQGGPISWGMAGRSLQRMARMRDAFHVDSDIPLIYADSFNLTSLRAMVIRTHVVATMVGPYRRYGSLLIRACAEVGTDYVDLGGDVVWIKDQMMRHMSESKRSGARFVFASGFGALPFDVGVRFMQEKSWRENGEPLTHVSSRYEITGGAGFSGGTVAAALSKLAAVIAHPESFDVYSNPYALMNDSKSKYLSPQPPWPRSPAFDYTSTAQRLAVPFPHLHFVYQQIHFSNFLLNFTYGTNFTYDQMLLLEQPEVLYQRPRNYTFKQVVGMAQSRGMTSGTSLYSTSNAASVRRYYDMFVKGNAYPFWLKPGELYNTNLRNNSSWIIHLHGKSRSGKSSDLSIESHEDPGYQSTARMLIEAAVCLSRNCSGVTAGFFSPAAGLGSNFVEQLRVWANIDFFTRPN